MIVQVHGAQEAVLVHPTGGGHLGHCRSPPQPEFQARSHAGQAGAQVAEMARDRDEPALVAQVVTDHAGDGRGGEGGKAAARVRIEALDGADEAQAAHLHQVVEREVAATEQAAGDGVDERSMEHDEAVAEGEVARSRVLPQERVCFVAPGAVAAGAHEDLSFCSGGRRAGQRPAAQPRQNVLERHHGDFCLQIHGFLFPSGDG